MSVPRMDGVATRQIVASTDGVAVLILTTFDDDTAVYQAYALERRDLSPRTPRRASWPRPSGSSRLATPTYTLRWLAGDAPPEQ
jgi:hypothetical protein